MRARNQSGPPTKKGGGKKRGKARNQAREKTEKKEKKQKKKNGTKSDKKTYGSERRTPVFFPLASCLEVPPPVCFCQSCTWLQVQSARANK